jgi:phosphoglycolate phosphatase-like HAD superfamily hydrolase
MTAVDTLALDVGGVLIDDSASFREVIRITVVDVQERAGVEAPWTPSGEEIAAFKAAGGFNDDADLCTAMSALGLAGRGHEALTVAGELRRHGGGPAALGIAVPGLPPVDARMVRRLYDERYWGGGQFLRRFGEAPHYVDLEPGMRSRELALVGAEFPGRARALGVLRIALVTGRSPLELAAAIELLGWSTSDIDAVVTGDMARKPDPACLDAVIDICDAHSILYVGDTCDDWDLVRRYREERPEGIRVRGVIVARTGDHAEWEALNVDRIVDHVDEVLEPDFYT